MGTQQHSTAFQPFLADLGLQGLRSEARGGWARLQRSCLSGGVTSLAEDAERQTGMRRASPHCLAQSLTHRGYFHNTTADSEPTSLEASSRGEGTCSQDRLAWDSGRDGEDAGDR